MQSNPNYFELVDKRRTNLPRNNYNLHAIEINQISIFDEKLAISEILSRYSNAEIILSIL